jgi:hypothetical protein
MEALQLVSVNLVDTICLFLYYISIYVYIEYTYGIYSVLGHFGFKYSI